MGIEKVNREGEHLPVFRLANSYGTGINAVTPEKADKVFVYIDEAGGNILETPICIVFSDADEVETFTEDLKEQARAVWG